MSKDAIRITNKLPLNVMVWKGNRGFGVPSRETSDVQLVDNEDALARDLGRRNKGSYRDRNLSMKGGWEHEKFRSSVRSSASGSKRLE